MSATGRGSDYKPHAAYITPDRVARALVSLLPAMPTPLIILEPSVGGGAFLRAILAREASGEVRHRLAAIDIDPAAAGLPMVFAEGGVPMVGDFLTVTPHARPDLIVGNPPFATPRPAIACPVDHGPARPAKDCRRCKGSGRYTPKPIPCAEAHCRRALDLVAPGGTVAFLLRLALLESKERRAFWRDHPCAEVHVLATRPSFTADGSSDSAAYGFFIWRQGFRGPTTLHVVDWEAIAPLV